MTDETPEEATEITRLYRAALNRADYGSDPAWARLSEPDCGVQSLLLSYIDSFSCGCA